MQHLNKMGFKHILGLAVICCVSVSQLAHAQEYQFGQATWYDSIENGFCGFGRNIPSNGFVGAWPYIETNRPPNGPPQGFWQPPATDGCADVCFEVSCVPQFVESADGSIFLDRRDACADVRKAIIIKIVDECRCSLPSFPGGPKGNFQWCCNDPTPRLGINMHIDLSKQAFTELVKDRNFNLGILGIRWRQVSCSSAAGVVMMPEAPPMPSGPMTTGVPGVTPTPLPPGMNSWNNVASTSKVALQEYMQCGGEGGACKLYGVCADAPFATHSCVSGLACVRQSRWYYQCLKTSSAPPPPAVVSSGPPPAPPSTPSGSSSSGGSSSSSGGSSTVGSTGGSTSGGSTSGGSTSGGSTSGGSTSGGSTTGSNRVLSNYERCGGLGGTPSVDDPFPGTACASGLRCVRQDGYYWQCLDPQSIARLDSSWSMTKPRPTATCGRYLASGAQCGGASGDCASKLGVCADSAAKGVCCDAGLTCVRQNAFYWGCNKA